MKRLDSTELRLSDTVLGRSVIMKLRLVVFPLVCFCSVLGPLQGASTNDSPEFTEVYELLRHHLAGIDETELSKAAVSGLLKQLRPRVALVGESTESAVSTNTEATLRTVAFDGAYGYIRIGQIGWQTDKQVVAACQQLTASNRLKGFVLDLRFAGGEDYAAATRLADMFFSKEKPLLDYGQGMKNSTEKTNALALPLTILVNRQTTGAAEAFAGVLRQADVGLLLGTNTAGKAMMGKEFPLKSGQRLWIATSLVKLGNGKIFPSGGLRPDIQVEVSPEDEEAYFEDAYRVLPKPGQSARRRPLALNLNPKSRI